MAAIKYVVKSKEKKRFASIYLRFVSGRSFQTMVTIPIKVYPGYWNNKTESFKNMVYDRDLFTEDDKIQTEKDLNDLRSYVLTEHNKAVTSGMVINKEWLQALIDKYFNKSAGQALTLNQYIDQYIKDIEKGERSYNGRHYAKGTIKNYQGFQVQFNIFQGIYTEEQLKDLQDRKEKPRKLHILNWDDITVDFYDDFLKFFTKKNYSANTIGRHVKNLKTLMRQAREEGLHSNNEIERKKFRILKAPVDNIYLTDVEVKQLRSLNLTDRPLLEQARDIFLIGCYTAQRFSDYAKIKPANIITLNSGIKAIDITQQKTCKRVVIPIRPELDELLSKYDYSLPKMYEQKLNERIKEVGALAGISHPVQIEENKGGLRVKKEVPKNELIKTHTARRTGATLMYLADIHTLDIMKITGHTTEREFLNYIKAGVEEAAQKLSKHSYFIGEPLKIAK